MRALCLPYLAPLLVVSCAVPTMPAGPTGDVGGLEGKADYFANTRRRVATEEELKPIVRMDVLPDGTHTGCTAFFVRNGAGRQLVASARHCTDNAITRWCDGGGTVSTGDRAHLGTCTRIVAADVKHDIAVFEVAMDEGFDPSDYESLRLGGFVANAGTRLEMVGFPADDDRLRDEGAVADNCWLRPDRFYPRFGYVSPPASHNCSTWGGNSGGPVLLEGTDVVVGMPATYDPAADFEAQKAPDDPDMARLNLMSLFVAAQRAALAAAKIDIVEHQEVWGEDDSYPGTGLYRSRGAAECDLYVWTHYDTGDTLTSVQFDYRGRREGRCHTEGATLTCDTAGLCTQPDGEQQVRWLSGVAFEHVGPAGVQLYERRLGYPGPV